MSTSLKRIFWAGYALLLLLPILGILIGSKYPGYAIDLFVLVVSTIGVWGFVLQKSLGVREIWMIALAVNIIQIVYWLVTTAVSGTAGFFALDIAGTVLYLPMLAALYFYAFKSPHIWAPQAAS